jgi:hypothetical protein
MGSRLSESCILPRRPVVVVPVVLGENVEDERRRRSLTASHRPLARGVFCPWFRCCEGWQTKVERGRVLKVFEREQHISFV